MCDKTAREVSRVSAFTGFQYKLRCFTKGGNKKLWWWSWKEQKTSGKCGPCLLWLLFLISDMVIKVRMTAKMLLLNHLLEPIFLAFYFVLLQVKIQCLPLWQSQIWAGWKWGRWTGDNREDLPFAWPWIWIFKPNCQVWESGYKILNKMPSVCPVI